MIATYFFLPRISLVVSCFFLLTACSYSNLKLTKDEPLPEIVKNHKSLQAGSQAEKVIQTAASSAEAAATGKSINELETKLKELVGKVAELDEMKKQLEVERKKTEQLSLALEEKEEREKDLLNKLSAGDKAPPVIVIASPVDGLKTESRTIQLTGVTEDDTGIRQLDISLNSKQVFPKDGRGIQVKTRELPISMMMA